jgi:hypothetical protein
MNDKDREQLLGIITTSKGGQRNVIGIEGGQAELARSTEM